MLWFVLCEDQLLYYKKSKDKKAKGMIKLSSITKLFRTADTSSLTPFTQLSSSISENDSDLSKNLRPSSKSKKTLNRGFIFEIRTETRSYFIQAKDPTELKEWYETIMNNISALSAR